MRHRTTTRPVLDNQGNQTGFEQIDIPFTAEEEADADQREAGWLAAALGRHIAAHCAEVDTECARRLSEYRHDFGAPHGTLGLQLRDDRDRTNWLTLDSAALKLIMSGQGATLLPMRTTENVTLMLPASDVSSALAAMAAYGAAVMAASWSHKDALRALADADSVASYDITPGWPA